MTNGKVTGVRSIELGVRDLRQSADFYIKVWALDEVAVDGDGIHLRATGGEHHVLTIRERPKPTLLGVNFAAPDRTTVDRSAPRPSLMASRFWAIRRRCPAPPAAATASASRRPTDCR